MAQGPHVFQGRLGDPKATERTLRDGRPATGALGALADDGCPTITGREKEILVTSDGRSLAPAPLEERVRHRPLVAQCVVVGNDRPCVTAPIALDPEAVEHRPAMRGRPRAEPAELLRDAALDAEVRRAVVAANSAVSHAESIRALRVVPEPFTEERGSLPPSLELEARGDRGGLRSADRRAVPELTVSGRCGAADRAKRNARPPPIVDHGVRPCRQP